MICVSAHPEEMLQRLAFHILLTYATTEVRDSWGSVSGEPSPSDIRNHYNFLSLANSRGLLQRQDSSRRAEFK